MFLEMMLNPSWVVRILDQVFQEALINCPVMVSAAIQMLLDGTGLAVNQESNSQGQIWLQPPSLHTLVPQTVSQEMVPKVKRMDLQLPGRGLNHLIKFQALSQFQDVSLDSLGGQILDPANLLLRMNLMEYGIGRGMCLERNLVAWGQLAHLMVLVLADLVPCHVKVLKTTLMGLVWIGTEGNQERGLMDQPL
jgi:hypothetical protein